MVTAAMLWRGIILAVLLTACGGLAVTPTPTPTAAPAVTAIAPVARTVAATAGATTTVTVTATVPPTANPFAATALPTNTPVPTTEPPSNAAISTNEPPTPAPTATAFPTNVPIPTNAPPPPALPPFDPQRYVVSGDRYDCAHFASQAQAQAVLRAAPSDPNRLDPDRNGIACESNLPPYDREPVPR